MDNWILKGAKMLANEPASQNITSPTQVKVKVSHLLMTNFDALVYSGDVKVSYPRIPGRVAVGIVTEVGDNSYGLKKGMRVYFEPARPCGQCLPCKSGKPKECREVMLAGKDFDGFMRDFVVCEYNEVTHLPDGVKNFEALCIETVGIAENIYDRLNLTPGQKVAVIGGNFTGNLIAQILMFHKITPIVIDNLTANIERAKKCGIYFTFAADDELEDNIKSATGGALCDAVIYCSGSRLPLSLISRIIAENKTAVFAVLGATSSNLDIRDVLEKNLTVFGVSSAYGYTDSVINLLLHDAVNLDVFEKVVLTDYNPAALLEERLSPTPSAQKGKMTILKMII